jgi:Secretion system C-terminal sorting domain
MKKITLYTIFCWFASVLISVAQDISSLQVKYMITYNEAKNNYTAWVVPTYDTPNYHNPDTEEKGVTAQFSIKVPKGFIISSFEDYKGVWSKNIQKLDGSFLQKTNNNPNYEYYVIGKLPSETNYGMFVKDEPIALFSFKGNDSKVNNITVLDHYDSFVKIADTELSLNVASSFYSRSGQKTSVFVRPTEQFEKTIDLKTVMTNLAMKNNALSSESPESWKVVVYPNPASSQVSLKFFAKNAGDKVSFKVTDMGINTVKTIEKETTLGMNILSIDVSSLNIGNYLIHGVVDGSSVVKKVTLYRD